MATLFMDNTPGCCLVFVLFVCFFVCLFFVFYFLYLAKITHLLLSYIEKGTIFSVKKKYDGLFSLNA